MRLKDVCLTSTGISFNPRICKRCDISYVKYRTDTSVSIHASVKDATSPSAAWAFLFFVSIHASVKDATYLFLKFLCVLFGFNPRICKRCDHLTKMDYCEYYVSIHASVKDATLRIAAVRVAIVVSIHASVKDATMESLFQGAAYAFQSTHL